MSCPNCGTDLAAGAKFCPLCGTTIAVQEQNQLDPTKKKNKKKLPIIIVAIILVLAIVAGIAALAVTGRPEAKVFGALKNTVFDSSDINIKFKMTYTDDEDEYVSSDIKLSLGDDIDSSSFEMKLKEVYNSYYDMYSDDYYDEPQTYTYEWTASIKNGKVYDDGEEEGKVSEYLDELEEELEYYDIDVDLEEEINNILNGKIDEKALEKAYNEIVAPAIEDMLEDEFDETIELPKYDDIFGTATELFKDKAVREALAFEKTKSDLPGTTYEYSIDLGDLAEAVLNYAMEDKQYKEYLDIAADEMDCDVDDIVDEIVDEFNDIENIEGTITVKSNKITNITIDDFEGYTIEIEIEVE